MDILLIVIASLLASLLTFFSGFGLGTLLTPVFAVFFPVETAIALTAIVHFLNNLFKFSLVYKNIRWPLVMRFGIPSVAGAFLGAWLLVWLSDAEQLLFSYEIGGRVFSVTMIKLFIAVLMIFFGLLEIVPVLKNIKLGKDKLLFGGVLSGFFGGLSGHQGALRSAFLIRMNLSKEVFIATGISIAIMVDMTRLGIYWKNIVLLSFNEYGYLLLSACLSAFAGAFLGNRLLKKITFSFLEKTVTVMIILLAVLLGMGVI